ncbi:MAG: caspase family protein, partial [Blastocatellia bacterium]
MNVKTDILWFWFQRAVAMAIVIFASLASFVAGGATVAAQADRRRELTQKLAEPVAKWPATGKRYALVIGVDEYQDKQISKLTGAANDARALAEALVRYAGFPRGQVILLATDQPVDHQPTRANILRKLSDLRQVASKDTLLLVSFSGHGFEREGSAYLAPMDTQDSRDPALLEESAINVKTMRERIRQTGAGQVIIVLDACRNNPTGRGSGSNPLTDAYVRSFNFDVLNREVIAFVTLCATEVGGLAYEDAARKQGYFTLALIEGLNGGAANEKGEVTLARLVDFV